MLKRSIGWMIACVALTAIPAHAAGGWGKGPNFARLAEFYIQGSAATANFTCRDIDWRVEHAVSRIEALLDAGKIDRAQQLADQTLTGIERRSERTIAQLQKSGENLAELLVKNGQTALADEVLAASASAVEQIQNAVDNAAWTLGDLFYIGAE